MGPKMQGIGWRGLDTRELYFDDVWVPDDHLVGDPKMGLGQFLGTLEVGRISIAALSLSLTQAVLDLALDYAKERQQFGQPISKFQAVQFKLADIATELEAARWLTYRAAYLRDTGQPFLKEASMAKLKASRVAVAAASEAVQIHGGLGYMLDTPVARFYCDAKVLEIGEGTNEIQHVVIAHPGLLSRVGLLPLALRRAARTAMTWHASGSGGGESPDRVGDVVAIGQPRPFELGRVRRRSGGGTDPLDRRVEVPESLARDGRRDLGADAERAPPLRARSGSGSSCAPSRGSAPCRAERRCGGRSPRPRCRRPPRLRRRRPPRGPSATRRRR